MAFAEGMNIGLSYLVGAFVTSIVLVIVLAGCANCAEKNTKADENGDGTNVVNGKPKSKKPSKKSKKQNGAATGDMELGVLESENPRNSNTSNGSVARDSNGTRPKSHDGNRALPEIPNGEASAYGDKNFHPYATVPGEQDSQTYAAVSGNSDLDPDYAGISTDTASETYARVKDAEQQPTSSIKRVSKTSHPYAEVSNIGEATYAQISEKPTSSKRKTVSSTISTDTIDSAMIPPVPDKNLDLLETGSNRSSSAMNAGSPSLPPRNSVLDSANIPYVDQDSPQHQGYDVGSADAINHGTPKKEPPYDDITARESLSHIRERQAKEESSHVNVRDSTYRDITYDREYDEIKSIPLPSGNRIHMATAGDRNSLASDTYAEIWQSDQAVGIRQSSIYSQVREVGNNHAPTPPPIDTLKQLSHCEGAAGGILRQRPQSTFSTTSSTYNTVADIDISTQDNKNQQPLYAVPNKRDKRQTVHGDMNVQTARTTPVQVTEHLYSQVDKAKKNKHKDKKARRSNYDNIEDVEASFTHKGARPKQPKHDSNRNVELNASGDTGLSPSQLDQANHNSPKSNDKRITPGYQTIGSVEHYPIDGVDDDPDYDTVQEGAVVITDPYDVDYESLPGSAAAIAARVSVNVPSNQTANLTPLATDDGNANSVTVSNPDRNANPEPQSLIHISQHRPRAQPFQRREHIYEVITDKSHENIYTADPTRHITTRKSKGPQQQFITNL